MRNLHALMSCGALILACCLPNASAYAAGPATHVKASSFENQVPHAEGSSVARFEYVESFNNIVPTSPETFSVHKSGTYFIIATGQVGANVVAPPGFLDL